ncbi:MAG: MurR/RpiR family transcriptional regulator [Erysipelotrichaceae bacterium]|nr:MurR/RpiR family transcriptional regulator [Erysipelotrichaceae bacterium]
MLLLDKFKNRDQFSSLDLAIIDYVLEHPKEVMDLTVGELAKVTYTSPSSVVRLCKKLGMKGYADFRIKLATEINTFLINEERIEVDMPITPDVSIDEVAKTFLNLHYQALVNTFSNLNFDEINEAVELLYNADCIEIRGKGPSLVVGLDFAWKLGKIGLPVRSSPLEGFDTFLRVKNAKNSVGVIISNYGKGTYVNDWMHVFRVNNTKVIMICSNPNSKIFQQADVKISVNSGEKDRASKLGSFDSRTSMLYVLDIIYSMIYKKDYNLNVKSQYEHGKEIYKLEKFSNEISPFKKEL